MKEMKMGVKLTGILLKKMLIKNYQNVILIKII